MTVAEFAQALKAELVLRGISDDLAKKHCAALIRTFSEEDIKEVTEYNTPGDFEELTESFSKLILEKQARSEMLRTEEIPAAQKKKMMETRIMKKEESTPSAGESGATKAFSAVKVEETETMGNMGETKIGDAIPALNIEKTVISTPVPAETKELSVEKVEEELKIEDVAPAIEIREKVVLTKRGRAIFSVISLLTSPLWIFAMAIVLVFFALSIVAVCALIAVGLVLVCVEAAVGCAAALVGLIYGIGQMVSSSIAIGLFEAGIGVAICGVVLAICILTYNFAVRAMPYLLKHIIAFEGYCLRRIPPILDSFREECNKL